jgi:hypothetical protein
MGRLLTGASGAAFVALGISAVIAPKAFSGVFGLPTDDRVALAFVRATALRDAILGALILASYGDPPSARRILAFSSVLGLVDALTVASLRGPRPQHVVHLGGFIALLIAARSAVD